METSYWTKINLSVQKPYWRYKHKNECKLINKVKNRFEEYKHNIYHTSVHCAFALLGFLGF